MDDKQRYVIYIREPGLGWLWGWYVAHIGISEKTARNCMESLREHGMPGLQAALLEWTPDHYIPLPWKIYFRWPVNTRLLFKGTVAENSLDEGGKQHRIQ